MYQNFSGLPKWAVIDTNTLLNACFIGESLDAHALSLLRKLGFIAVLDDSIEQEALQILKRLQLKFALAFDPAIIFHEFLLMRELVCKEPHFLFVEERLNQLSIRF